MHSAHFRPSDSDRQIDNVFPKRLLFMQFESVYSKILTKSIPFSLRGNNTQCCCELSQLLQLIFKISLINILSIYRHVFFGFMVERTQIKEYSITKGKQWLFNLSANKMQGFTLYKHSSKRVFFIILFFTFSYQHF